MHKTNRRQREGKGVEESKEGWGGGGGWSTTLLRGTLGFIHNFLQVYLPRYLVHIYVFVAALYHRLAKYSEMTN